MRSVDKENAGRGGVLARWEWRECGHIKVLLRGRNIFYSLLPKGKQLFFIWGKFYERCTSVNFLNILTLPQCLKPF